MGIVGKTKLAVLGLFVAGFGVSQADKSLNYAQVDAVVTKAEVDCFIKNGNESVVEKSSDKLAYMDCEMAPFAAAKYGFKDKDISKRTKLAFNYTSPVDGSKHNGEHVDEYIEYKVGQKIKVYAHKEDPTKMRWN